MDNPYCDLPYWWWYWQLQTKLLQSHYEYQLDELRASDGHCLDIFIWHPE